MSDNNFKKVLLEINNDRKYEKMKEKKKNVTNINNELTEDRKRRKER